MVDSDVVVLIDAEERALGRPRHFRTTAACCRCVFCCFGFIQPEMVYTLFPDEKFAMPHVREERLFVEAGSA